MVHVNHIMTLCTFNAHRSHIHCGTVRKFLTLQGRVVITSLLGRFDVDSICLALWLVLHLQVWAASASADVALTYSVYPCELVLCVATDDSYPNCPFELL